MLKLSLCQQWCDLCVMCPPLHADTATGEIRGLCSQAIPQAAEILQFTLTCG